MGIGYIKMRLITKVNADFFRPSCPLFQGITLLPTDSNTSNLV